MSAIVHGVLDHSEALPSWWRENGNVLLGPPDLTIPPITAHPGVKPPQNARVTIRSAASQIGHICIWGQDCSIVVGEHVSMPGATLNCGMGGAIVLEGSLSSSISAWLDARNGGIITVGSEGLWSVNVRITTDDMHAIRDIDSNQRVNRRGSSVTIGRHVWLGMDCVIQPGAVIGDNSVVGIRSVVSGTVPSNVVVVGVPARVVRDRIT